MLFCVDKAQLPGNGADFGFPQLSEREKRVRKLKLRERIEHIALILCFVNTLFKKKATAAFVKFINCVMPGCNIVMLKLQRPFEQLIKLEVAVAVNAGVRRCAFLINVNEFSDNLFSEIIGKIENIKRYAELIGNTARILGILKRAAGFFPDECVAVIKKAAVDSGRLPAVFQKQICAYGAVNAAAHSYHNFFVQKNTPEGRLKRNKFL